jgi:hypothetical protein
MNRREGALAGLRFDHDVHLAAESMRIMRSTETSRNRPLSMRDISGWLAPMMRAAFV